MFEDMLRAYILQFKGSWDEWLHLIKFAYNNSYHSNIVMTPYEMLQKVGERRLYKPKLVQATTNDIKVMKENLKVAATYKRVTQTTITRH